MAAPAIASERGEDNGVRIVLSGRWTLIEIAPRAGALAQGLAAVGPGTRWDCGRIEALDSAGAVMLWRAWGRRLPGALVASDEQRQMFARIASADSQPKPAKEARPPLYWLMRLGGISMLIGIQVADFFVLIGRFVLDVLRLLHHPGELPSREISANVYKAGVKAMPVTALVGFLIGIVLSYLSALQLRQFGADIYIVNILGMGIIRELGPVLVAVLVAGRSGSAMTAQLGVMRVTEEIDALATMGIPRSLRLVFPKVAAMAVVMPLLVLWTTVMALAGGMVAAQIQLDIGYAVFADQLPKAVPVANLWIGLAKGFVFGIFIALVACHYGLRVRPNTESLSSHTTASVVTAITVVILIDAIFAILTRSIGVP